MTRLVQCIPYALLVAWLQLTDLPLQPHQTITLILLFGAANVAGHFAGWTDAMALVREKNQKVLDLLAELKAHYKGEVK